MSENTTPNGCFIFVAGGERCKMSVPTEKVFTPDWVRRNRNSTDDVTWVLMEELAGESGLKYEAASWAEHRENMANLEKHTDELMGVTPGEASP